jgi:hypothetical protein
MNVERKGVQGEDAEEIPYGNEEFAEKYGLSRRAAEVILSANGASRHQSDAGARAFLAALAARPRR